MTDLISCAHHVVLCSQHLFPPECIPRGILLPGRLQPGELSAPPMPTAPATDVRSRRPWGQSPGSMGARVPAVGDLANTSHRKERLLDGLFHQVHFNQLFLS